MTDLIKRYVNEALKGKIDLDEAGKATVDMLRNEMSRGRGLDAAIQQAKKQIEGLVAERNQSHGAAEALTKLLWALRPIQKEVEGEARGRGIEREIASAGSAEDPSAPETNEPE